MGADPPPAPANADAQQRATEAAIAKVLPTPRLFRVKVTGSSPPAVDGSEICMGAAPMMKLVAAFASQPETVAALTKGCTETRSGPANGRVHAEIACDKAAGAATSSHMTIDGAMSNGVLQEIDERMEMSLEGAPGRASTPIWVETHLTLLGDCPAEMKPGQLRTRDGKISDPLADLAAAFSPTEKNSSGNK